MAVCIADVAGKGTAAAILMANLQAVVRSVVPASPEPAAVCTRVNEAMCDRTSGCRFITFFYALLDPAAGTLAWCNAGHNAPILQRPRGAQERLSEGGIVLGVLPGAEYVEGTTALGGREQLVLFTDGIVEACDAAGAEYGEDRLVQALTMHGAIGRDAQALQAAIFEDVRAFCGGAFVDDATLLVMAAADRAPGKSMYNDGSASLASSPTR